jgi:hypothetical protein
MTGDGAGDGANEGAKAPRATGRCLCGAITIRINGALRDVVVCHCGQCRRWHGAPPGYSSARLEDVEVLGRRNLKWYESSPEARRGFCRVCGSSLFWEPRGAGRVAIAAGCLDQPTNLHTICHIFTADKGDFYEITDGLEQLPQSMTASGS